MTAAQSFFCYYFYNASAVAETMAVESTVALCFSSYSFAEMDADQVADANNAEKTKNISISLIFF